MPAMKPALLDLFCGAGGCTMGYQRAGFRVIGVDNRPQKRYVGEAFILGDALAVLATLIGGGRRDRRTRPGVATDGLRSDPRLAAVPVLQRVEAFG